MDFKRLILGIGLLAASTLGTSAQATIMTVGDSAAFSFSSYDGLYDRDARNAANGEYFTRNRQILDLTLDRFDASLGSLLDVDIWFESTWSLSSTVDSVDPRNGNRVASARGRSVSRQRVRLMDPNNEVVASNEFLASSCNDRPSCSATTNDSGLFNGSFDLGAFSLADFIGSDALDIRVVRLLDSDLRGCGGFDFCSHENSNNAWSGTVHVDYTYNVPEPSTLLLMGLGLGGIGASRLRRTKR